MNSHYKNYYPAMLDMQYKSCVVIGGGEVAERKITSLLKAQAEITVVSPSVTAKIHQYAEKGKIQWFEREYLDGDIKGFLFVIIATDNLVLNKKIYQEINPSSQFVNVVDAPKLCTFIVPSVIDRGPLQISISTNGASPGLAKKIRKELEDRYGEDYIDYTNFLAEMREWILSQGFDQEYRKNLLNSLLDDSILLRIKNGKMKWVIEEIKSQVNKDTERDMI